LSCVPAPQEPAILLARAVNPVQTALLGIYDMAQV
jgi:hypothetical protein